MRTFRTTVKNREGFGALSLVAVVTTRALTIQQAEKQALDKVRAGVVRDRFGQVIESPDLIWLTREVC